MNEKNFEANQFFLQIIAKLGIVFTLLFICAILSTYAIMPEDDTTLEDYLTIIETLKINPFDDDPFPDLNYPLRSYHYYIYKLIEKEYPSLAEIYTQNGGVFVIEFTNSDGKEDRFSFDPADPNNVFVSYSRLTDTVNTMMIFDKNVPVTRDKPENIHSLTLVSPNGEINVIIFTQDGDQQVISCMYTCTN